MASLVAHCVCLQCTRPGFDPWVGKIPWRRKWQPIPVFLPGESHGQRSLAGYSPQGLKESDTTERLHTHKLSWVTNTLCHLSPSWESSWSLPCKGNMTSSNQVSLETVVETALVKGACTHLPFVDAISPTVFGFFCGTELWSVLSEDEVKSGGRKISAEGWEGKTGRSGLAGKYINLLHGSDTV